jgi:hypothetical protein
MNRLAVSKEKEVTLLDLLDRILNKGVILWGDVTLSVADVDLIYLSVKVLLTSVETARRMRNTAIWAGSPNGDGEAEAQEKVRTTPW